MIHLTAPYGPFDNVLAFPALGIVIPSGTPMSRRSRPIPPPGVGPYKVTNIVAQPVVSTSSRTPMWTTRSPASPSGHVNVDVKISRTSTPTRCAVLNNSADIFDWADTIPGSLLPQIQSQAKSRFSLVNLGGSTYYIFLNMQTKPVQQPARP